MRIFIGGTWTDFHVDESSICASCKRQVGRPGDMAAVLTTHNGGDWICLVCLDKMLDIPEGT